MYCKNCGKANDDDAMFCAACGAALNEAAQPIAAQIPSEQSAPVVNFQPVASQVQTAYPPQQAASQVPPAYQAQQTASQVPPNYQTQQVPPAYAPQQTAADKPKSKTTAGLLALFFGALGIHNFYLGFTTKAIIQLVVSLVGSFLFGLGPVAMWIWAFVEAIMCFTGKINTDAKGNPLV